MTRVDFVLLCAIALGSIALIVCAMMMKSLEDEGK
jgi:hypothetical protein